ncbi:MAG: GAF domain-containing protein, partial [Acidimicrobiales bacterium]
MLDTGGQRPHDDPPEAPADDRLQRFAATLSRAVSAEQVAEVLASEGAVAAGSSLSNVIVLDRSSEFVRFVHSPTAGEAIAMAWSRLPVEAPTPLTDAVRTGSTVLLATLTDLADRYPHLLDETVRAGLEATASVPLRDETGAVVGAAGFGWSEPQTFHEAQVARVSIVAELAAQALNRAQMYEAQRSIAAQLDTFITHAPVGFAVYDADCRYVRVNDLLAEINGVPSADHIGRMTRDVVPGMADAVEPLLRLVLDSGVAMTGIELTGETPAAPGVMRHWLEGYFPIPGKDGRPTGVGCVAWETTEQKQSEVALTASAGRAERLAAITTSLSRAVTVADVARVIAEQCRAELDCASASILEANPGGRRLRFVHTDGTVPDLVRATTEFPLTLDMPMTRAWLAGCTLFHGSPTDLIADFAGIADEIAASGVEASLCVPLIASDEVVGMLSMSWSHPRALTEAEELFVETIGGHAAQALERARLFEHQRSMALTLQQALLPGTLPKVEGVELAAFYAPGADGAQVGGDWYDVFVLPSGRLEREVYHGHELLDPEGAKVTVQLREHRGRRLLRQGIGA